MKQNMNGRVRPLVLALILLIGGLAHDHWWMWGIGAMVIILLIAETAYYSKHIDPLD